MIRKLKPIVSHILIIIIFIGIGIFSVSSFLVLSKNGELILDKPKLTDSSIPIEYSLMYENENDINTYNIANSVLNLKTEFSVKTPIPDGVTHGEFKDNFFDVISDTIYDNPLYSTYRTGNNSLSMVIYNDNSFLLNSDDYKSSETLLNDYEKVKKEVKEISDKAFKYSGESTVKYVTESYRILSTNTTYTSDDSQSIHSNDIYGAIIEKESKCYGLSCAMKAILDEKNVPNYIGYGTVKETQEQHAWNVIFINNRWYVCDLTSGSSQMSNFPNNNLLNDYLKLPFQSNLFFSNLLIKQENYYNFVEVEQDCVELQNKYVELLK